MTIGVVHAFVVNRPLAALFALGTIVLSLLVLRVFVAVKPSASDPPGVRRRQGLGALVIGADGRASTSKLQAVLWTFAVFFAVAFMLFWGRSSGCSNPGQGGCQEAQQGRAAFDRFVNHGLQPEYYVLLGFPLTVAIAAKAITTAKVDDGTLVKAPLTAAEGAGGFRQSVREIVTNDGGEIDLLDAQYFAFNLLTLAFFFTQLLTRPGAGLPDLPPTLIALSGLAAAGYTSKKALTTTDQQPLDPDAASGTPPPNLGAPSPAAGAPAP
jgi:hypothetical protein